MDGLNGLQSSLPLVSLPSQASAPNADEIQKRADGHVQSAADELEVHFATLLVKEMRSSLGEGLFGSGPGADTFEGWFDDHLGRAVAEGGGLELVGLVKAAAKPQADQGSQGSQGDKQ